jgi:hypothetical protein
MINSLIYTSLSEMILAMSTESVTSYHGQQIQFTSAGRTWLLNSRVAVATKYPYAPWSIDVNCSGPAARDLSRRWQTHKGSDTPWTGVIAFPGIEARLVFINNLGKRADGEYQITFREQK